MYSPFRIKTNKTGDGPTNYVLTFVSIKKTMHSIIQIEDRRMWINKARFSTFPALVHHYMNKKKTDEYYLLTGLNNLDLPITDDTKRTISKSSSRHQPQSLPWYHGKINNKVFFYVFSAQLTTHSDI